jgi:hypothetical protein
MDYANNSSPLFLMLPIALESVRAVSTFSRAGTISAALIRGRDYLFQRTSVQQTGVSCGIDIVLRLTVLSVYL